MLIGIVLSLGFGKVKEVQVAKGLGNLHCFYTRDTSEDI